MVDEFKALRISMDKKEFNEINDSLKRIILVGRSANVQYLLMAQRAETSVIDGAIRDTFAIRIGKEEFISRKPRWYLE